MRNPLGPILAAITSLAFLVAGCGGGGNGSPVGPNVSAYYVADTGNNRVVRFSSFASPTGFVSYGTLGTNQNQLTAPSDIAFDGQSRIYILDSGNGRIVRIDSDFTGTDYIAYGSPGSGVGQFSNPMGIVLDGLNR